MVTLVWTQELWHVASCLSWPADAQREGVRSDAMKWWECIAFTWVWSKIKRDFQCSPTSISGTTCTDSLLSFWMPPELNNCSSQQLCSFKSKTLFTFREFFSFYLRKGGSSVIQGLWPHWIFPSHKPAAGKAIKIPNCGLREVQEANKIYSKWALNSERTLLLYY